MPVDHTRHHYADNGLEAAIADPLGSIVDLVKLAEWAVAEDARVSESYRSQMHLVHYRGHPWWRFVESGNADWLGWSVDEVPRY